MIKRVCCFSVTLTFVVAAWTVPTGASLLTFELSDGDPSSVIDPLSLSGTEDWTVDWTDHLSTQVNNGAGVSATIVTDAGTTPSPYRFETNTPTHLLTSVAIGELSNAAGEQTSSSSPRDRAWAFQWDEITASGASLAIRTDTDLSSPVFNSLAPAPASVLLLGSGLTGLIVLARRRQKR